MRPRFAKSAIGSIAFAVVAAGSASAQGGLPKGRLSPAANIVVSSNASSLSVTWDLVKNAASYYVNQRPVGSTTITQLGSVTAPPYNGPLPAAGTPFEYQVVALAKNFGSSGSSWIAYTVPAPVTAVLVPATTTTTTGMVTYAGPAVLTAQGVGTWEINGVGQCALRWSLVTNALKYRVLRMSSIEPERMVAELSAAAQFPDPAYYDHTDAVSANLTYEYRVSAVLTNGATTQPSPFARCKAP